MDTVVLYQKLIQCTINILKCELKCDVLLIGLVSGIYIFYDNNYCYVIYTLISSRVTRCLANYKVY